MKTAMQELIDELKKLSEDRNADNIGIKNYMEKQSDIIDKSLEKEKEQIISSVIYGQNNYKEPRPEEAEEYYNQTYNQNN